MNPLRSLNEYGQVVWLDFLSRRFIADASLKRLIDEDGLAGATSTPRSLKKRSSEAAIMTPSSSPPAIRTTERCSSALLSKTSGTRPTFCARSMT